jgi:chemotaxis response regulator CheB
MTAPAKKIKVLVVDDSAIVRKILSETIASEPDLEVVGTAPDPYVARDKILALHPDVLTLDIEMPRMDGLTFLKRLMRHHPIPTIIISSLGQASCAASLEALRCGAVDVICKPAGPYSVGDLRHNLATKIRAAAASRPRVVEPESPAMVAAANSATKAQPIEKVLPARRMTTNPGAIIAIGASTGGTVAIQDILLKLPADMPGIVITQHIPAGFSLAFANRLNKLCAMEVREAVDGDAVRQGLRSTSCLPPSRRSPDRRPSASSSPVWAPMGHAACSRSARPARPPSGRTNRAPSSMACRAKQPASMPSVSSHRCPIFQGFSPRPCSGMRTSRRRRGSRPSQFQKLQKVTPCITNISLAKRGKSMKGTVLVVDDSAMMRKVVLRTLKMAGVEFETILEAGDGQEALTCLRANKVELIMCDINMPVMSGLELLQAIKDEKLAIGTPIVMVTTEGSEPQVRQAILAGARGYIRKPFTVEHIENNVKPLLAAA